MDLKYLEGDLLVTNEMTSIWLSLHTSQPKCDLRDAITRLIGLFPLLAHCWLYHRKSPESSSRHAELNISFCASVVLYSHN